MDNRDFEIELEETAKEDACESVQLPLNFLSFGEIENDDVKVYIKQDVYKALEKLAASDTSKELGSIILGQYAEELGKTHVIISDYIEAKYTDASASTLTFTHETWEYVHKQHEKLYSDKKIIGWQHTHPNYGIFLSNYDMFIQENFFNMPFQVAYVIDPVQNLRGFFQWKNGKIEKLKGYYIYDDIGKPIKIEQKKIEKKETVKPKSDKVLLSLVSILCVVCLVLGCSLRAMKKEYRAYFVKQNEVVDELNDQIIAQEETIHELEQTKPDTQEQDKKEDAVVFKPYKVKKGDTLSSICKENDIEYASNLKIILSINGIIDADMIVVGQTILLPILNELSH